MARKQSKPAAAEPMTDFDNWNDIDIPEVESDASNMTASELSDDDALPAFDRTVPNTDTPRLGGPTGGNFKAGKGPTIGATHAADDNVADHYGSREETNAALEEKIALQNTRKLHGRF